MIEEEQPPAPQPEPQHEAQPEPPPVPERFRISHPFWGYHDLFLFVGLMVGGLLASTLLARVAVFALQVHTTVEALEPLVAQFLLDGFIFAALAGIFRLQYDQPFWRSLAWTPMRIPGLWIAICGFVTAIAISLLAVLIHLPTVSNPMTKLLEDRVSVILMAAFGVTLGPLFEELVFRGFLQPLVVRSLGAVAGVIVAAVPFGLLHFREYGNSWRHALLISAAGAAFGWMRQATGSTRASTLMHASYNALNFLALFARRENLPQAW
jgi:membrane protease YdiL (CAAX protease family)